MFQKRRPRNWSENVVEASWNVMAHGDAREGKWRRQLCFWLLTHLSVYTQGGWHAPKWRGNWRMEWVASTLLEITNRCNCMQWILFLCLVHSTCFGRHTRSSSGAQSSTLSTATGTIIGWRRLSRLLVPDDARHWLTSQCRLSGSAWPIGQICREFYKTNYPWNYRLSDRVQYSVMASRTAHQARSKGLDAGKYCK